MAGTVFLRKTPFPGREECPWAKAACLKCCTSFLLDKRTVTARELAGRLEVSVRNVYRDVERLSAAGIPVYMSKGRGGGIRLLDGFVLDKSMLSQRERREILSALHGLRALRDPDAGAVLEKLAAIFGGGLPWVDVEFSHWGSRREEVFALLKNAIIERRTVEFEYIGSSGEKSAREAEPLQLWFKHRTWYLKAYCLKKQAYRIFKLSRMKNVRMTPRVCERQIRDAAVWPDPEDARSARESELVLRLSPSAAPRVCDEFDESEYVRHEDGSFTVRVTCPEDEWVYGYVLSFGDRAEVIAPRHVRDNIRARLENMLRIYRGDETL